MLPSGTMIELRSGKRLPVQRVRVGETLTSSSEGDKLATATVESVYLHGYKGVVVTVNEFLTVTPEHVIFTRRGWAPAIELQLGDVLAMVDEHGRLHPLEVSELETRPDDTDIYGITVDAGGYFANRVLVREA